jgi:uncharacterized protein (TIGR02145 family)
MEDNSKSIRSIRYITAKRKIKSMQLFSIFAIIVLSITNGYTQTIENIRTTSDNQKVIIEYDLLGADTKPVFVSLKVKVNNTQITPQLVNGDVESVKTGRNKRIVWLALEEIGSTDAIMEVSLTIQSSKFNEIKIGSQVWMTENLNVDRFRNGDLIPEAKTADEWKKAGKEGNPAWCYNNNDPVNGQRFGKLYNWYAVNDPRGLAPEDWKIPSNEDWRHLSNFLGGEEVAGKKMKSTNGWNSDEGKSGNGTNESGFSGLPGGDRNINGDFGDIGYGGTWWSSTVDTSEGSDAWFWGLAYFRGYFGGHFIYKSNGYSVRCLRD